jgi:hypothetical protein
VAGVTLDELLEGREAFTRFLSNELDGLKGLLPTQLAGGAAK